MANKKKKKQGELTGCLYFCLLLIGYILLMCVVPETLGAVMMALLLGFIFILLFFPFLL